jgi:hypothetical protein
MVMKKVLLIASIALLAGCNSATKPTPENYLTTLNAWLPDHPDCLLDGSIRFPYETSDPVMTKKMDALVASQMMILTDDRNLHVKIYALTKLGTKASPNFCFGYRKATDIVSSTPPAMANGFPETQVVYKYVIRDLTSWADTPQMMAAFPVLAAETSGNATDTITLALTRISWSVPG